MKKLLIVIAAAMISIGACAANAYFGGAICSYETFSSSGKNLCANRFGDCRKWLADR